MIGTNEENLKLKLAKQDLAGKYPLEWFACVSVGDGSLVVCLSS